MQQKYADAEHREDNKNEEERRGTRKRNKRNRMIKTEEEEN